MDGDFGIGTGSYVEDRDDWARAVERARGEGWRHVELTAVVEPLLPTLAEYLGSGREVLEGFERVSLHAPIRVESPAATVDAIVALPLEGDVIFHPDFWGNERAIDHLGERVVFENMDIGKRFGRFVDDLHRVFDAHADAGFCLDVAHVWTNDPTLLLGHELIDDFGDRLRQLHVSGIERDGTHRPTTPADLELYRPLLDRCRAVPWILEAVLEV